MRQGPGTERPRGLAARSMRPEAFLSAILLFLTGCRREKRSTHGEAERAGPGVSVVVEASGSEDGESCAADQEV